MYLLLIKYNIDTVSGPLRLNVVPFESNMVIDRNTLDGNVIHKNKIGSSSKIIALKK